MQTDWQDAKEQVRQAIDIVDLVGGYLSLRRQGRNFVALCPWHDDSRPSLQINPERQSYKCWVCDLGGDVFSFLMQMEGLEFREALETLAERAGIDLAALQGKQQPTSEFDRRNLFRCLAWAEQQFHQFLQQDAAAGVAREYLAERGILPESIEQFQLGFSPDSWDWLLRRAESAGFSPRVLERVGLVLERNGGGGFYDRFRGRLLFSIRDVRSRPIAFGGRILPGAQAEDSDRREAKYINSPETPLFSKSEQLYALDQARTAASKQGLAVMEGYTDVIMAHQHGITNSVAVLGTALGERHVQLINRYTDRVTLVLDGDEAGQKRTMQIMDELLALFVGKSIDLRVLSLPPGADPCDVILSQGSEAFQQRLEDSPDALDYKISAVTNGLDSATGTHRASLAMEAILATLARAMPTGALASSAALLREQQVLARLSHRFGLTEEAIRTRLSSLRANRPAARRTAEPAPAEPLPQQAPLKGWERELLELLVHHPDTMPRLSESIAAEDIAHPGCKSIFAIADQLMHDGQVPTFDQLMTATEDAALKNLLVDCDESGREKASSDTEQRLADVLRLLEDRRQKQRHQETISQLHQQRLEPGHADQALGAIFSDLKKKESLKRRQPGSSPTEG